MLALVLALTCQWLEPMPDRVHDGEIVRVVVKDADGRGVGGIEIQGGLIDGEMTALGMTDREGLFEFRPRTAGTWRLAARLEERALSAPLTVFDSAARRRRRVLSWTGAALLTLAGVAGLRRRARARHAA
ncbi:MAG: hypothetical protein AB7I19_05145 [Planctomycetota bacterium]